MSYMSVNNGDDDCGAVGRENADENKLKLLAGENDHDHAERGMEQKERGEEHEKKPAKRIVILVTVAVFMGYAALVLLQNRLAKRMCLENDSIFQHGCSFNYIGNLLFRIAHNFVFAPIKPRHRVYISLISMCASMSILGIVVVIGGSDWVGWSYICYFLGGMAIGTFESNLLTSITPLGHATKVWAIVGMPTGFAMMSIGGFAFRTLLDDSDEALACLYLFVAASCVLACFVFCFAIPDVVIKNNSLTLGEFVTNLRMWRQWFPQIRVMALALCLNMFFVSFFSGIMFYILNDDDYVPLFGKLDHENTLFSHGWFFTIFNMLTFAGDSLSRRFVYHLAKSRNPLWYLAFSVVGTALCLCYLPIVAPLGIFCIFFANGAIYGTSTKFIDENVDKSFNLIALSVWLFLGDLGSVTGSNLWEVAKPIYCDHFDAEYMCVHHNTTNGC